MRRGSRWGGVRQSRSAARPQVRGRTPSPCDRVSETGSHRVFRLLTETEFAILFQRGWAVFFFEPFTMRALPRENPLLRRVFSAKVRQARMRAGAHPDPTRRAPADRRHRALLSFRGCSAS
jgi:hypothetical protein